MKETMSGNRVLLKLGGKTIGAGVQNTDFQDDFGLQDVDGQGDAESAELVAGKATYTISLSRYFVYNKKLTDLGLVPESKDYLHSGELEIEVLDKVTGKPIELYSGCKAASHGRSYPKHVLSTENVTFRALHKHPLS